MRLVCATGTAPHVVPHIIHLLWIVHAGCVARTAQTSPGISSLICSNYMDYMASMGTPVCNSNHIQIDLRCDIETGFVTPLLELNEMYVFFGGISPTCSEPDGYHGEL